MIGRIAETLYWIGRYMERVENHARLIDVDYHLQTNHSKEQQHPWQMLVQTIGDTNATGNMKNNVSDTNVLELLLFNPENRNSVLSCAANARGNAQSVRQCLPSDLWEVINGFYLWMKAATVDQLLGYPHGFFQQLKQYTAIYQGVIDSVMLRDHEWHILQAGKYLERSENTLRILKTVISERGQAIDFDDCLALLKTISGFEAFRKSEAGQMSLGAMIDFMILNRYFPRSTGFAVNHLYKHINILFNSAKKTPDMTQLVRTVGRMRARFAYAESSEIIESSVVTYLSEEISHCNSIGKIIETIFSTKEARILPF
ncbi:MAG: alpha-E domain-containing protein [Sporolactobacillus sp.]